MKSDHIRFFLSLRAAFFSSSNINAIAANCLLENEWGCIIYGDKRGPPIMCYAGRWLNATVWTQINLTEWRGNDNGTETWRIVWIGPKTLWRNKRRTTPLKDSLWEKPSNIWLTLLDFLFCQRHGVMLSNSVCFTTSCCHLKGEWRHTVGKFQAQLCVPRSRGNVG